jgi:hypothetical protein
VVDFLEELHVRGRPWVVGRELHLAGIDPASPRSVLLARDDEAPGEVVGGSVVVLDGVRGKAPQRAPAPVAPLVGEPLLCASDAVVAARRLVGGVHVVLITRGSRLS